ncbi:MAG: hypothetical protein Q7K45_03980, partial [Nanoarchaeota archaeon]|nr:hypothetical protein [Nanoarchaeota archaeon]
AYLANDLGGAVDLYIELLREKGISVKHIQNAGDAIAEFKHIPYDAIGMDLHITTGLDCNDEELRAYAHRSEFGQIGLQVITRTRSDTSINQKTPMSVVCHYQEEGGYSLLPNARKLSLEAGANDYFNPITMPANFSQIIVDTIAAHATREC